MSNADEIVKYVNLLRIKKSKEKTDKKIDLILNSPNADKLINKVKKEDLEKYVQQNMIEGSTENLYRLAKSIQHKYPDMLENIINFYISEELGYYLIKTVTQIETIKLSQARNIIKCILCFDHESKTELAENICFMANHFLDLSNKFKNNDFKNQITSILVYEIFNMKDYEKVLEEIKLALAKKLKYSNEIHHCYIPYGDAYTLELRTFENAIEKYENQLKKEIGK